MIITSAKEMRCTFTSARGHRERYYGTIRKFGLDIGATGRGVLVWDVLAPTGGPRRRALAGDYGGVDASATVGAGVGANALVGGVEPLLHFAATVRPGADGPRSRSRRRIDDVARGVLRKGGGGEPPPHHRAVFTSAAARRSGC